MLKIEKFWNGISATTAIHFDNKDCFCGNTYVYLIAHKYDILCNWKPYSIGISIHDMDDLDVGVIYQANSDNFIDVLHLLINWMNDREYGITYVDDLFNSNIFPEIKDTVVKKW